MLKDGLTHPIGKNKKVIGFFKDELGETIMKEFVAFRVKTYSYLMDDDSEHKKAKGTNKRVIKIRLMFENYTDSLFNDKTILKLQQRFQSDCRNLYTEEVNKIALSSNIIRDYKHLIKLQHIHTKQTHLKYAKVRC